MYEVYLEFPEGWEGGGILENIPSLGEVWIFSGITQSSWLFTNIAEEVTSGLTGETTTVS